METKKIYAVNEIVYKKGNAQIRKFTSIITGKIRFKAYQNIGSGLYDKAFDSKNEAIEHINAWELYKCTLIIN